ncbi:MAG: chromosome segregation protein SMC [Candidatus Omnitrophica bacterium]|nr:chromosome segregation protein SMC [Candidatus Omnitrophota bacterium]
MYFKSLELFGFKSFADRTRLDFEPGITAIVGPNGCGKSNISDSIRWVLGEQSAKMMRGGKMEDVIFNGTDGKEPVGYAEVSLTLSNQDRKLPIEYDEVTVGRRLYRSGESEYLLNKTSVRLKDISELFMGTGVGTNAYSHIEQGRIDQVLSSRPEDRREIFEEAAGITKYKSKRKEALRRLDDTELNLVRINDIIAEVKRQINSIERQARKAERYKEKYEELKSLELKLSRIELELLQERLLGSNKKLDEFRAKEVEISSQLQKASEELSALNAGRSGVETKRMDLRSNLIEKNSEVSKARDKISLNKDRVEELKKRRIDLEVEIEKSGTSVISQRKEVENLREKVTTLEKEDTERAGSLEAKEKRLVEILRGITENETNISTSKANVIDIASRQSNLRNRLTKVSNSLATNEARLKRLETEKIRISHEKETLDTKLADIAKEVTSIEGEVLSLREEKSRISNVISELSNSIEKLVNESEKIHRSLAASRSRLEVLEEAKAKYEGFSSGVKAILGKEPVEGQSVAMEGVRDVLANLLSVKQGYELAIESALGDYLQAVVVDTMESAEKAINFLRENSCGRTSFIYPGAFDHTAAAANIDLNDERLLGKAEDFITIDDSLKGFAAHALKNIFIVKDLSSAGSILKDIERAKECVFITLEGALASNGFVSGGMAGNADLTLINRDARIKELSLAIIGFEADAARIIEEKLNSERLRDEQGKNLEDTNRRLNEKEILFGNAKHRQENIEENIKGVDDEISLAKLEIEEVTGEMESLRQEEASLADSLTRAEEDARLNGERIVTGERAISECTREKEQLLTEVAEQKTELGSLESKKEGFSNTLHILESSLNDSETALGARKTELETSIKRVEELEAEALALDERIRDFSEERVRGNTDLEGIESVYKEMMADIELSETVFRQSEKEINDLRSRLHEIDLKKAETNYSVDNLKQRITDVYKLDIAGVQIDEAWQAVDMEQLKNEVKEKREKIDSMGSVNLVAIEEHTELQDRFAFLNHQRDDLFKAKDSLLKAITKINKTTKDLFMETFRQIQIEFRSFFKMLFGGGDGEIVLIDEGDVLESGIEIVARPPGKRLQNVSLLSGGEKALTAIALLFAIFKVKPSPFCVLDEIDAPLDESNVDRFSKMFDLFTDTSQFIVITHNKKTIDRANVMYGITMQESGVSKVVSVKFSDSKKQEPAENPA